MELLNSYKKNKGLNVIFKENIPIEWYDGITTGLSRLVEIDKWYLSNLYYFDPVIDQRVFSLISVSEKLVNELKDMLESIKSDKTAYASVKEKIKLYFNKNIRNVYFMKAKSLDDIEYEIVKAKQGDVKYFADINEAMHHSDECLLHAEKYFPSLLRR